MPTKNDQIPLFYQITFNWVEPLLALGGATQAYFSPNELVAIATPNTRYDASMHPFFTQIAGGWILMAFNDAVTLRLTQDVRIWTSLLAAGFLSDLLYILSLYEDLGAAVFWNPLSWSSVNWLTMVTTLPPMLIKFAFIAGLGLDGAGKRTNPRDRNQ